MSRVADMPVLYDHLGVPIKKGIPDLDPSFFKSRRSGGTGAFSNQIARQPYAYHSWVYACVERIVNPVASLPKVLYRLDAPDDLINDHPVLSLFANPNPLMCGTDLWEAIILGMLLPTNDTPGGQVFLYPESGVKGQKFDWRSGKIPAEIWPYTDNIIKPRRGANDILTGWKMVIRGQTIMEFEFHELIRIRKFNPYDPAQGLSPYTPAQIPITQDTKADEFNTMFFDNHGAIGGVLSTENDTITVEELRRFKEAFEQEYMGAGNAGKIAALAYGLKYEQFLKSNKDMEFVEQRKDNRFRIQAVFGMNDEEIGIFGTGMNRATAEVADRSVWQKTRIPLDDKIWESINHGWLRYVDDGKLRGKSDRSKVEALREDYSTRIADAEKLKNMNVPPAEALRITGVPVRVDEYPYLGKTFVPMSMMDIELLADMGMVTPTTTSAGQAEEPKKEEPEEDEEKAIIQIRTLAREKVWDEYVALSLDPGEKSMRRELERYFYGLRNEMQDNVDEWLRKQSKAMRDGWLTLDPIQFLFSLNGANEQIIKIYGPEAAEQMRRERDRLKSKYDISWNVTDQKIGKFVDQRKARLMEINNVTFDNARKIVGETVQVGIEENWTPAELAKNLKDNIGELSRLSIGRTRIIARTEIGSITSASRFDAFEEAGIAQHDWLTARDEKVRVSHQIDGEIRQIGTPFSNGLMHPLDPHGPVGEIVNCRCTTTPVMGDE